MRLKLLGVALVLVMFPLSFHPLTAEAGVKSCHGKRATIILTSPGSYTGTPGDDVIVGTPGDDTIDTVFNDNNGGVDIVCGGGGNDTIFVAGYGAIADGESGADRVYGYGGAVSYGGSGNDFVAAGCCGGASFAYGGSGNDTIHVAYQGSGDGGSGNDFVQCITGLSCVALYGGSGNDTLDNYLDVPVQLMDCGSFPNDVAYIAGAVTVKHCETLIP